MARQFSLVALLLLAASSASNAAPTVGDSCSVAEVSAAPSQRPGDREVEHCSLLPALLTLAHCGCMGLLQHSEDVTANGHA
jgi:hypothetical protein